MFSNQEELIALVESEFPGLFICEANPIPALKGSGKKDYCALEKRAISIIEEIPDEAEEACKTFLEVKGYKVFADEESVIDEFKSPHSGLLASKLAPNVIGGNLAADVLRQVSEIASKEGWGKVEQLLNQY